MTLAEDLDGHEPDLPLDEIIDLLEPPEREALRRALTDRKGAGVDGRHLYRWGSRDLSNRLAAEGWRVSADKIQRWRTTNVTS